MKRSHSPIVDEPSYGKEKIEVFLLGEPKRGWGPIGKMAHLAAQSFETSLSVLPEQTLFSRGYTLRGLLRRPRRGNGRHALIVAGVPGQLRAVLDRPIWLGAYESVSAWVIDSFWDDRVPRALQRRGHFDHLWVADSEDLDPWENMFPGKVDVLEWGTDALGAHASVRVVKTTDLQRVGRQPDQYDDDSRTTRVAEEYGISFSGRPSFGESISDGQLILEHALSRSRGVLAFTNLVDSTTYTHPTKEYVTGRWVDSLAFGALPVGRRPMTATAQRLVPDQLSIEIDPYHLDVGMAQIKRWLAGYSPESSRKARLHALQHLDWRYRFATIARTLGVGASPTLLTELAGLDSAAAELETKK